MKLTYDFVKGKFEEKGYTLLSNYYINSKTKLDYICPKGHRGSIRWNDFKTGYGCPYCAGKVKNTIEEIKVSFTKEDYTLLSKDYVNNKTKLEYICSVGHKHFTTWANWNEGCRCPTCAGQTKPTIDFVKKSFEGGGYILLSTEYKNAHTKLDYICSSGHKHNIMWKSWQNGSRCPYCSGRPIITIEDVRISFEKEGYILLSTTYINSTTKFEYECPRGHVHSVSWLNWYHAGSRCPTCYKLSTFGSGNPSWKGGKSLEGYCPIWKDKEYKSDIRNRDGNRCLNPYCDSKDPSDLTIHHIDYDKKNCHPSNLITVCRSCNARANFDRKWHKVWYQAVMRNRYKYNY